MTYESDYLDQKFRFYCHRPKNIPKPIEPKGWKKMYIVNYNDGEEDTFEIFSSQKSASNFAKKVKPATILEGKLNTKRIFKEKGKWNYEDTSDLFRSFKNLKKVV